jgi:hypothetical protein
MAMNYHQDLEKTGVMEISKLIEESANSAPVMPEEQKEEPNKKKQKNKKEQNKKSQEK